MLFGNAIVLPIVLLVIGQISGVMYFSVSMVLLIGLICWIIDAVLFWYGGRLFQCSKIIVRL